MHRLLMIVLLPSVLLLGFAIPVAAERRERISTAQSLSPTLTLFRSESEFVSAVDVDSTETFDAFPSNQTVPSVVAPESALGYPGLETTIDEVVYTAEAFSHVPWSTITDVDGALPVSAPNVLLADGYDFERVEALSFGPGQFVEGIGFYFVGTGTIPSPSDGSWFFAIEEVNGELVSFRVDYDTPMPTYIGLHSSQGILRTLITDDGGFVFNGLPTLWGYDNVSRTLVLPEPNPGLSLIGSLVMLLPLRLGRNHHRTN